MVKRTINKRNAKRQHFKTKKELAECPHCGQEIKKGITKCYHCNTSLTFLGRFERLSSATTILATISTIVATSLAIYAAWVSIHEREVIETIKKDMEKIRSEASYFYVFSQHQQMEASAAAWRRCKALKQPDCKVLSFVFLADAQNAINAFDSHKNKMEKQESNSIQEKMCVSISITHNDGKNRGLYESVEDHLEANSLDKIKEFLRKCPKYRLERVPARRLQQKGYSEN